MEPQESTLKCSTNQHNTVKQNIMNNDYVCLLQVVCLSAEALSICRLGLNDNHEQQNDMTESVLNCRV